MKTLYIDFETYYDRQYSLRKLTTAEYVLSPWFECYMAAWAVDDGPIHVTDGVDQVAELCRVMPWGELRVVAHNIHFDGAVLAWRFRARPARWGCTLAAMRMAHPEWPRHSLAACSEQLGIPAKGSALAKIAGVRWAAAPESLREELRAYARRDLENCRWLWRERPPALDGVEGRYLDMTVRLWTEPRLMIDSDMLVELRGRVEEEQAAKIEKLKQYEITPEILRSDVMLARKLETYEVEVPYKPSPTDPTKTIPAFSKRDMEFVEWSAGEQGDFKQMVAEARFGARSTMERTRVERLLAAAQATGGVLPVPLVFGNTNTLRLAGGEKWNLQNLPRTEKLDKKKVHPLRRSIYAPAKHKVVRVDAAQIECRILSWWAGEEILNSAFREKRDPYCEFGSGMFGRTITKADWERHPSKIAVLSCGYGAGNMAFETMLISNDIKSTPDWSLAMLAYEAVRHYRKTYKRIARLWRETNDMLPILLGVQGTQNKPLMRLLGPVMFAKGHMVLPSGHDVVYPGAGCTSDEIYYWTRRGCRIKLYGSKLVENAVQAMARDHVMEVWDRLDAAGLPMALQVHDDLSAVVHEDAAPRILPIMKAEMSRTPTWAPGLLLDADGGIAVRLGDAKE